MNYMLIKSGETAYENQRGKFKYKTLSAKFNIQNVTQPSEATPEVKCPVLGSWVQQGHGHTGASPEDNYYNDYTWASVIEGETEKAGSV